jgi:lysozyme
MKTSDAGLNIIKKWEGLRLTAYPDPATGGEPYTIGYGHTYRAGPPKVTLGMRISSAEALSILKDDLKLFEDGVYSLLKKTPTQAQFDAMVSLAYNIGLGNFKKSTVLRKFNEGDFAGAAEAFMLFVKANGKVMQGLINRRSDERELFLIGTSKPIMPAKAEPATVTPKADSEVIISEPKPVYASRRVWASMMGWLGGGGVATFGAFSGFDYRTLLVLVGALGLFVLFFWFIYRKEIRQGLFSK